MLVFPLAPLKPSQSENRVSKQEHHRVFAKKFITAGGGDLVDVRPRLFRGAFELVGQEVPQLGRGFPLGTAMKNGRWCLSPAKGFTEVCRGKTSSQEDGPREGC